MSLQARKLPAARGFYWLSGGFRLWRSNPLALSMTTLFGLSLSLLIGSIPWLGSLIICLLVPFVDAILLRVCHALTQGGRPDPRTWRAALERNARSLLILGLVMFVMLSLSQALSGWVAGDDVERTLSDAANASAPMPANVLWAALIYVLCASVLSVIMWIAPMLSAYADVPPFKSLVFSIIACWRNKGAFLVFGLVLVSLSIPLSLVLLAGPGGQILASALVFGLLMPVCAASNYLSVSDIFGALPGLVDAD
ncbi:BPSS1780 family membrane protein [Uliginosibacterium sediminicola]|uniref:BPSS1780 family membrane protein n=1 Tax=Uliginosibacterium sediminicola TaxID=2024550 RepID=A0ABU9Z210_9RHOO